MPFLPCAGPVPLPAVSILPVAPNRQRRDLARRLVARGDVILDADSDSVPVTRQGDLELYSDVRVVSTHTMPATNSAARTPPTSTASFIIRGMHILWYLRHCWQDALTQRLRLQRSPALMKAVQQVPSKQTDARVATPRHPVPYEPSHIHRSG